MKTIELGNGAKAKVDDWDFEVLKKYKWHLQSKGYATTHTRKSKAYMHRVVLWVPNDMQVDHINHDKLDNRKINLRAVTPSENQWNRKSKSKTEGIYKTKNGKWSVTLWAFNRARYLGTFTSKSLALKIREEAKQKIWIIKNS